MGEKDIFLRRSSRVASRPAIHGRNSPKKIYFIRTNWMAGRAIGSLLLCDGGGETVIDKGMEGIVDRMPSFISGSRMLITNPV